MLMYPLTFYEFFQKTAWGGATWQLSQTGGVASVVSNGKHMGLPIYSLFDKHRIPYLGKPFATLGFPILIKTLHTRGTLSLQVHPGKTGVGDSKNEILYILDAGNGAEIAAGLAPGATENGFYEALGRGEPDKMLRRYSLKKGDLLEIPAGLVHSIRGKATIIEILENSDTTYRFFDYDTLEKGKKRELHPAKAKEYADFTLSLKYGRAARGDGRTIYDNFKCFNVERYEITGVRRVNLTNWTFLSVICVDGRLAVTNKYGIAALRPGQVAFLPANSGGFVLSGSGAALTVSPKSE